MKPTVNYRKASVQDIEQLVEMRWKFFLELSDPTSGSNQEQLKRELHTYFESAFENNQIVVWVATIQQQIIATSTMVLWQPPIGFSGVGKNGYGYILNMYTLIDYRKQGICANLLNYLLEEATLLNLEKVHLHATEDGIKLYKKAGFKSPQYPELVFKL